MRPFLAIISANEKKIRRRRQQIDQKFVSENANEAGRGTGRGAAATRRKGREASEIRRYSMWRARISTFCPKKTEAKEKFSFPTEFSSFPPALLLERWFPRQKDSLLNASFRRLLSLQTVESAHNKYNVTGDDETGNSVTSLRVISARIFFEKLRRRSKMAKKTRKSGWRRERKEKESVIKIQFLMLWEKNSIFFRPTWLERCRW